MKSAFFLMIQVLFFSNCFSQKVIYTEPQKKDVASMKFEILGKFSSGLLVHKNASRQHSIAVYDKDMQLLSENNLDFIPDKIIDIDFICYPDHFFIIYQYQKNNIVFCAAADLADNANVISGPFMLESTSISFLANNKIYSATYSEDKSKILLYKRYIKNDQLEFMAVVFDAKFNAVDSFTQKNVINQNKEMYSDVAVDNDGNFIFAQTFRKNTSSPATALKVFIHQLHKDSLNVVNIPLDNKAANMPMIKIDNRNKKYLFNAFYYSENERNIEGLLSVSIGTNQLDTCQTSFNTFSSERKSTGNNFNATYDNLIPKNIILRKSGGFMLIAEDFYNETLYDDNRWNRYDPYNPYMPYSSTNGYYMNSPYYNNYRPYGNNFDQGRSRYYYNNIFIADVDSSLQTTSINEINKRQYETDNDNNLSFGFMNTGKEIHFMFIENAQDKSLITDHALSTNGNIRKFPIIRNEQRNYEFMPKLAKQVGANMMVVPFLYFNKIGFAKIEL
jgi:hypothetical protein